jgi:tetratricopeptide (TPR) repeat protein
MRAFVFTDKALESEAGRFVWLEMNTDRAQNAAFKTQYKIAALPTYFIVDPDSETVLLRRVGGATVPQLLSILEAGRSAYASQAAPAALSPADRILAKADALYGAGDYAAAAGSYREALAAAPGEWPAYERAIEAFLFALQSAGENEAAAQAAREAYPRLIGSASLANVAVTGLDCALALPPENPARTELVNVHASNARGVVSDLRLPIAADDRSAVFGSLVGLYREVGDSAEARAVAERWAAFLEAEAARATDPEARAVFDPHRMSAYFELNEPERALPMLEASERDLPDDYNPPARLAAVYARMERWNEGLAAAGRALAKAYGPRKLRILQTRADLQTGMGDVAAARRTMEEALALAESLPPGQRSQRTIDGLRKAIEAMGSR